jgi:hypothetical protein
VTISEECLRCLFYPFGDKVWVVCMYGWRKRFYPFILSQTSHSKLKVRFKCKLLHIISFSKTLWQGKNYNTKTSSRTWRLLCTGGNCMWCHRLWHLGPVVTSWTTTSKRDCRSWHVPWYSGIYCWLCSIYINSFIYTGKVNFVHFSEK